MKTITKTQIKNSINTHELHSRRFERRFEHYAAFKLNTNESEVFHTVTFVLLNGTIEVEGYYRNLDKEPSFERYTAKDKNEFTDFIQQYLSELK